jgi:hypothetical protein
MDNTSNTGPQAIGPVGIKILVAKLKALRNEKMAYRMNNQRIALLRGEEEKRGATKAAASEEKKPQPRTSKANITEPSA